MFKVGIIGPESTGKSTLARYLAKRYHGVLIPEYARTFVEQLMANGRTDEWTKVITYEDVCRIAKHQIEELKLTANSQEPIAFYDTELIVTKVWFQYAFGRVPEWLEEAIQQYPMDVYLLCRPDIAWEADKARSNSSDEIRQELFERYEQEIEELGIPYYIVEHDDES